MDRRQFITGAAAAGLLMARPTRALANHSSVQHLPYGGVCTHVLNKAQYRDTAKVAHHLKMVEAKVARDEWCPPGTGFAGFARRLDGIHAIHPELRWVFVTGRATEPIDPVLDQMEPYARLIVGIEGPNEWNLSGRPDWRAELSAYTEELYAKVRARRAFKRVPVVGPSLAYPKGSGPHLGDHSAHMDVGNVHIYQPSYQVDTRYVQACIDGARVVSGAKPMIATELNGQIGDGIVRWDGYEPTEADQAWCYELLMSEVAKRGVHRGFCYQLLDHVKLYQPLTTKENRFGCFRADWSPKPLAAKVILANRRG